MPRHRRATPGWMPALPLSLSLALALALAVGCGRSAPAAPPLLEDEARLALDAGRYLGHDRGPAFRPTGAYREGGRLWVYARDHRDQVGFEEAPGGWVVVGRRTGPRRTELCEDHGPPFGCLCVGSQEPRGVQSCDPNGVFRPAVPDRSGFLAMAVDGGRLFLLDGPAHRVHLLGPDGRSLDVLEVDPGTYALAAGGGHLWLASWNAPHLVHVGPEGRRTPHPRGAPVRALRVDPAHERLWIVGPRPAPVRRPSGPVGGLGAVLEAWPLDGATSGRELRVDLGAAGLIDPTALALFGDAVAVVATGSRAVALHTPGRPGLRRLEVGAGPSFALSLPDGRLVVPGRLDDRVHVVGGGAAASVLDLGDGAAPTLVELGELLFTERHLGEAGDGAHTCNSCHWDGGTDHRRHPGYREARWEQNRSLAGLGMVAPPFTAMQASTLSEAVDGLVEVLADGHGSGRTPSRVPFRASLRGRPIELDEGEVRRALLHFLMRRPVERGPWRRPDGAFTAEARAGAALFLRDCASCHETSTGMRRRERVRGLAGLLGTLRRRPLVFGAPVAVDVGVRPPLTPAGARVSPLLEPWRGGPYFSNGSAPSLDAVLRRSRPGTGPVHAPGGAPFYGESDRRRLLAFLRSL
jgi:hypothetical protein